MDESLGDTGPLRRLGDFEIVRELGRGGMGIGGKGVRGEDMMTLLHRVVFYGSHIECMRDLAPLMGWKVVEEA